MSHDPAAHPHGHGDEPPDRGEERLSTILAVSQFFVTGLVLFVIAALAYVAGMHSAGREEGGKEAGAGGAPTGGASLASLVQPTPELIAEGKNLYQVNCASCHGAAGHGDGPAAAALNPRPRNFTEGYWKYGGGLARVVRTISEGSPGTAMAAFTGIPMEDRIKIAHYVRSLAPKHEEDKPEDLAWLGVGEPGQAPAPGGAPAPPAPTGPVIPIERAIAALAEPEPPAGAAVPAAETGGGPGASLYNERCASCHGRSGEGGVRVRMLGSSPYAYLVTRSLGAGPGGWADPARFEQLVLRGIPGYAMPANGDLTRVELRDLHGITLRLRALQQSAGRAGS